MTDVADRLRDLADELEEDDNDGLPVYDGYRMVEEVHRRSNSTGDDFVVYRDEDDDCWIRCGDSWASLCVTAPDFADAILEANDE